MKFLKVLFLLLYLASCTKSNNTETSKILKNKNVEKVQNSVQSLPKVQKQDTIKTFQKTLSDKDLETLKGIWIIQDLIQSLQETHSIFETREILEQKELDDFLTLAIPEKSSREDLLNFCIGSFFTQMPLEMYASKTEITKDGYYIARLFLRKGVIDNLRMFFKIQDNELKVKLENKEKQVTKTFIFQKASNEKDNICFRQINHAYFYMVEGSYRLLDTDGKVLNENIWFDGEGNTNFPNYPYFNIFSGFQNSVNHAMGAIDKTKIEKQEMLKNGAIDKEDLLILRKHKEYKREETQQFIIQKTAKGFDIYTLKEDNISKWQLLYKKDLVYKLERREGKKKKPYLGR